MNAARNESTRADGFDAGADALTQKIITLRSLRPYGDAGLLFRRTNQERARNRTRPGGVVVCGRRLTSDRYGDGSALRSVRIGGGT